MSVELTLLVVTIAFVTLVIAIILALIYGLFHMKQLTKTANQVKQELVTVSANLKPLLEHADWTVQTINDGMTNSAAIVKNSKHITQSVSLTLEAIQEVTQKMAQRAQTRLKDEATQEQAQLTMQWADIVMQVLRLVQQIKQGKNE